MMVKTQKYVLIIGLVSNLKLIDKYCFYGTAYTLLNL